MNGWLANVTNYTPKMKGPGLNPMFNHLRKWEDREILANTRRQTKKLHRIRKQEILKDNFINIIRYKLFNSKSNFSRTKLISFIFFFINYIPIFLMILNKCYIIIYKSDKNCIVVKLKNFMSIQIVFLKILNSLIFSKLESYYLKIVKLM